MNADGRKGSSACKEPRIDPLKLLTCLKVLLDPNAGIRSANEVKRLAELMAKYSKKLVSKCIYIQILKSTDTELLGKFMGVGGWLLTHMWLSDAIKAANWPLVQEILELLLLCPVDVQRLRSNTAPKLVKGLSRDGGNEGVRILATRLVEQWLKVVKGETMAAAGTSAPCDQTPGVPVEGGVSSMVPGADGIAQSANKSANDAHFGQNLISPTGDAVPNGLMSQKGKSDEALIYKIVSKDGKQVVAKVTNGGEAGAGDVSAVDGKSADESADSKTDDEDKQSNKENETKGGESEDKDAKDGDKEKSRSKDKDRHRDHKSSSSRHKSSSSSKSSSKSSSSSSSKSKSSHNSSNSSSSSKHKDKESSDKDKHRSSSKSSSSSSSKDKSRSKDRDREKSRSSSDNKDKSRSDRDKERERSDKERRDSDSDKPRSDTDKDKLPSIDKLGKIPKKIKEEETPLIQSITIPSKKASMSIEIRRGDPNRPKTVKTYNSQFRSHGLSEEAPPPPSRKGLRKPPPQSIPGTSIPSNVLLGKRLSPPPSIPSTAVVANATVKDFQPPVEKKLKIDLNTAPATEKPGAVKFIAPKPKPSTLVESDMFMDALSAAAPLKKDIRKRKRRSSASKEPGKEPTTPDDPESPVASKVTPLKFYQDTLEDDKTEMFDDKDDNSDDKKGNDDEDDIPLKKVKEQIEEKVREEKELEERRMRENEEPEEPVKKPPGPGCGPDGPPGVLMLHRRKGPKKKLTWKPQANLEEVRFFELDENERVNVTKTFTDMKQMERFNEREAFMLARKLNADDTMVEQTPWVPLIEIDDVPAHPEGSQSKEKKIQMERELTTLKALYFNRHMIPHSPSEPDMEQYQITEPAVIPLDDITGNPDAINDFTSMPWPDPKGSPPQGDEFMSGSDMGFPGGQFNPFMSFPGNGGWMGAGLNNGPPNAMMPPMGGPMGNFNPMMGGPPSNMMMNGGPPNMMMGPPDDMGMNCNMNMMQPNFGLGLNGPNGPNFGGPPNGMGGGFNNFGPPMGMNHNMNMNMNNGPPRGGGGGHRGGGNWRSGTVGPSGPNDGPGGVWRGGGRGGGGNPRRGGGGGGGGVGRGDNTRPICKQFQRGFCRNGNKCNFFHPPGVNQRF